MIICPQKFKRKINDLAYISKDKAFLAFGEYANQKVCIHLAPQPFSGNIKIITKSLVPDDEAFVNEILLTQFSSDYFFAMFSYNEEMIEKAVKHNSLKKMSVFGFASHPSSGWNQLLYSQDGELRFIHKSFNKPFKPDEDQIIEEVSVFKDCLTVEGIFKDKKKKTENKPKEK